MSRISSISSSDDVPVGDHHQQQQLDHGLVLAVGGGVHRHVAVQVAQLLVHRWRNLSGRPASRGTPQEVELVEQQVLGDDLLRGHVRDADQGQHLVRLAGGEQRRRQLQRVGGDDVVVGEAVDQQQRPGQRRRPAAAATSGVRRGRRRRVAEVALGVVRVVQPPLGDRRAGDAAWNTSGRRSTASAAR